jgi:hypothetical protein
VTAAPIAGYCAVGDGGLGTRFGLLLSSPVTTEAVDPDRGLFIVHRPAAPMLLTPSHSASSTTRSSISSSTESTISSPRRRSIRSTTGALPLNPGIEELVATLCTLRRLPDALTARIALPDAARAERPAADVEAAIHQRAQLLAVASRRDALAVRSQGRSQSPLGIVIGLVGGFSAYGLAYLAKQTHDDAVAVALLVVAALALAVGWIVGWVVLEAWILDWRTDARKADACELLADARVELVAIDAAAESHRTR